MLKNIEYLIASYSFLVAIIASILAALVIILSQKFISIINKKRLVNKNLDYFDNVRSKILETNATSLSQSNLKVPKSSSSKTSNEIYKTISFYDHPGKLFDAIFEKVKSLEKDIESIKKEVSVSFVRRNKYIIPVIFFLLLPSLNFVSFLILVHDFLESLVSINVILIAIIFLISTTFILYRNMNNLAIAINSKFTYSVKNKKIFLSDLDKCGIHLLFAIPSRRSARENLLYKHEYIHHLTCIKTLLESYKDSLVHSHAYLFISDIEDIIMILSRLPDVCDIHYTLTRPELQQVTVINTDYEEEK